MSTRTYVLIKKTVQWETSVDSSKVSPPGLLAQWYKAAPASPPSEHPWLAENVEMEMIPLYNRDWNLSLITWAKTLGSSISTLVQRGHILEGERREFSCYLLSLVLILLHLLLFQCPTKVRFKSTSLSIFFGGY